MSSSHGSSKQLLGVSLYRWLGLLIKVCISFAVVWFIYERLNSAEQQLSLTAFLGNVPIDSAILPMFLVATLLMASNWMMEVVKWKLLVTTQFPLTWKRAVKGVLSGITFGLFTPNRMGEFFGRVLTLGNGQRIEGALLSFVNGIAQTVATLSFGVGGIILLLLQFGPKTLGWIPTVIIQITVLLTLVFAWILYTRVHHFAELILRIPWAHKYEKHLRVFEELPDGILVKLYGLSLARFTMFIAQYFVVFQLLMPTYGALDVLSATVLTLFSITLLPFFPVPDLLLRESFALGYFELYQFDPIGVSVVVFLVWGINVAFPSLLGAITLFTFRFFKSKG